MPFQPSDLARLSPHDFELLVRDIAEERFGQEFESYASGRDGGIDIRSSDAAELTIIQCKRYIDSTHQALLSAVKAEKMKVRKLRPARYVVASARRASEPNKRELEEAISGWAPDTEVWTGHDIAQDLDGHPSLVRRHPKLWLPTSEVLSHLLNAETVSRTTEFLREAREELAVFVTSDIAYESKRKLDAERVIILSGDLGVGKTSLAKHLALEAAADGVQVHLLGRSVREGFALIHDEVEQLFIFDDFLGKSKLTDLLGRNEGSDLARFTSAVRRSGTSRLVLTTRDYVLHAGMSQDDTLHALEAEIERVVVRVSDYDEWTRARILYNHLHYSDLSRESLNFFVSGGAYRRAIRHRFYNPRLISSIVELSVELLVEAKDFPNFFLKSLDDPSRLWSEVFHRHLGQREHALLATIRTCSNEDLVFVRSRWKSVVAELDHPTAATSLAFQDALRILEPTFLGLTATDTGPRVGFANPGVGDVASALLCDHEAVVAAAMAQINRWGDLAEISEWSSPFGLRGDFLDLVPYRDVILRRVKWLVREAATEIRPHHAVPIAAVFGRLEVPLDQIEGMEALLLDMAENAPSGSVEPLLRAVAGIDGATEVENAAVRRAMEELSYEVSSGDELELAVYVKHEYPDLFEPMERDISSQAADFVDHVLQEMAVGNAFEDLDEILSAAEEMGYLPDDEDVDDARRGTEEWEPDYDRDDVRTVDHSRGGDEIDILFGSL